MASEFMQPQEVHSWKDLAQYLSQSLSDEYRVFGEGEVRQTSTFLKTYLLEVDEANSKATDYWDKVFPSVLSTREPELKLAGDQSNSPLFLDVRDPRFCLVHTVAKASDVDPVISASVDVSRSGLDRAWLPSEMLFDLHRIGSLKGFRFSHLPIASGVTVDLPIEDARHENVVALSEDYRLASESVVASQDEDRTIRSVTSQTRRPQVAGRLSSLTARDSDTAYRDFEAITSSGVFAGRRSLDWVQYRTVEEEGGAINHQLYSHGKVTANGTSIGLHLFLVERLREQYASAIRRVERDHWLGWKSVGTGQRLTGEPVYIVFPHDMIVTDLYGFAKSVFRAARPFRLFGTLHNISPRRIDIEALDLHTNQPFSVELTNHWMRIYLPTYTCGNVLARLLTNLQRTSVSGIVLSNGDGENLMTGAKS